MVGNRIFPLDHKNTVCTVSTSTNHWDSLSWKMAYSMILVNNTKWVSSQLFGCGRAKLGPLRKGTSSPLRVYQSLLVWPVGHMDSHITDWATKPSQVWLTGNLPTWMWGLNLQCHSKYSLLYVTKWQRNGERFLNNLKKREGHVEITQSVNVVFIAS